MKDSYFDIKDFTHQLKVKCRLNYIVYLVSKLCKSFTNKLLESSIQSLFLIPVSSSWTTAAGFDLTSRRSTDTTLVCISSNIITFHKKQYGGYEKRQETQPGHVSDTPNSWTVVLTLTSSSSFSLVLGD